jgi:tight adherence protein B
MTALPIILIIFASLVLLTISFIQVAMDTSGPVRADARHRLTQHVRRTANAPRTPDSAQRDLAQEERMASQRKGVMTNWLRKQVSPNHWLIEMERQLARAHAPLGPMELLGISACLMLLSGCIGYWLGLGPWMFVIGASGFALPWLYLKRMQATWQKKFERQLSDALVLMANALRAGYSFLQSIETVARESDPPISEEFERFSQEIAVGVTVEQALENIAERVPTTDVRILVTAVLIQRQVGGALSEILDSLSEVIRQRVNLRAEVTALTSQQRFSGYGLVLLPVLFAIAAELLIRMIGGSATGQSSYLAPLLRVPWLIGIGLGMQAMGMFMINRIIKIEV